MAGDRMDVSLLGDKELQARFHKLEGRVQKKVLRLAMRQSARKVIKPAILQALSGWPVVPRTGKLLEAMKVTKIKIGKRRRHLIQYIMGMPRRSELGIDPEDPWYYPAIVEYGHGNIPAHSWIRAPVNRVEEQVRAMWRRVIGKGIEREAKRKA